MLNLLLLAGRSNGLIENNNFDVISCNNLNTNLPEITLSIKRPYFDTNLSWLTSQFTLTNDGLLYKKVIPEDQLDADLDDQFLYLNYYLNTQESRRKRDVFDDISLGNKPEIQFTCKYPRTVFADSNPITASESTSTDEDLTRTGFLEYQATVQNVQIGRDYFTEVLITPKHHLTNIHVVPIECRVSSGENELFPIHSFGDEGLCLDERLEVQVLDMSQQVQFQYRTFRFESIKTIDQTHKIQCKLKLESVASTIEPDEIQTCTCFSNESCDSSSWSYWSDCDGGCKQTRIRNKNEIDEETESRDCKNLCFLDVEDDVDENLKTCLIQNSRSRRDTLSKMTSQPMTSQTKTSRLMNGSSAYTGSLPYVVRLTFQNFDQFHSDTQQYNLCAGTVIDKNWILTSATCCKRDDIVTIKFNDYSVFYEDNNEHEITSTLFHIHQDLDGCLIRTAVDMSDIVDKIPCIQKNFDITSNMGARCWNPGWGSNTMNDEWATNLESIGVNLLDKLTCQMRSYWSNLYDNEICAVSAPTETTAVNGYGYHVVAGGKETCAGDYGSPLLCDINGDITLVGVNSRGFDECGAEGYPAIHISMNSINSWVDEVVLNESGIIWTDWSHCDSDCKQTRTRTKYESEIRECKGVCFKPTIDIIDDSLGTCSVSQDRKKRNAQTHNRIMGGDEIVPGSMPYVAKLEFKQNNELNQLCAGTVINQYFIATTKFCCESGNLVAISFEGDSSSISSNTFYFHSTLDACLIRVETDLSMRLNNMPCLPTNIDINNYNGAACWNAGWGTSEVDGVYSDQLESVGVNLMSQAYCTDHSFWEVTDGHICAGLPPNDSTPMHGWKHVTAGGKETCQGDFGAPLICDIAGTATLIGINSDGDLTECGLPGKPAIHVNVAEFYDWLMHIINDHSPPKMCFKFVSDPSIQNSLGDEIKIFKNEVELGVALNTNQLSNEVCFDDTQENDMFKFMTAGNDNVFIKEIYINGVLKDFVPFWIDEDGDLENDPYTNDCSTETTMNHPHAYSDLTIQNGQVHSKNCIEKQPVYSSWSVYSSCSQTCGGGEQFRTRECDGGICSLSTPDDLLQTQSCNTELCLPLYSSWSVYSSCSKTCGGGEQSRTRECVGGPCSISTPDDLTETQPCNVQTCPVWSVWGVWNTCSESCGSSGTQIRTRTCDQNCADAQSSDLTDTQSCNVHVCPLQCIDYRENLHCTGISEDLFTIDPNINALWGSGFERCGNRCLSTPGVIAFNWSLTPTGHIGTCECLGSVISCSDPGLSAGSSYGNGLIQFIEKEFCSNGVCNDVTVCQTVNFNGEAKFYLPLRSHNSDRTSNASGSNAGNMPKGATTFDAVRLIETSDGLFIKLNDGTFTRTKMIVEPHPNLFKNILIGQPTFFPFTYAFNCLSGQSTESKASLEGSNLKFANTVLPYRNPIGAHQAGGGSTLTKNNQVLTVWATGQCADIYFVQRPSMHLDFSDNDPTTQEHLLPVNF